MPEKILAGSIPASRNTARIGGATRSRLYVENIIPDVGPVMSRIGSCSANNKQTVSRTDMPSNNAVSPDTMPKISRRCAPQHLCMAIVRARTGSEEK